MADSIEQKIINRALEVMAVINGTGGYLTTLGTTVAGGATVPSVADSRPNWEQGELPSVSVFQGEVNPEDRDNEAQKVFRNLPLMFRGQVVAGTDATNARKFIADLMRAIRSAGDKWAVSGVDLAHRTDEGPHSIEYEEGSFEITAVQVAINIFYIASHLDMEA